MTLKVSEDARLEIKFVAYEVEYQKLLSWLTTHPAGFSSAFPPRLVNNVYFDTHCYSAFAENLIGVSARTKVRYRWYGDSLEPDTGVLEVKRKRNYFGWKLHYKVPESPGTQRSSWRDIRQNLRKNLSNEGKIWFDANPFPILINRYHRLYFLSADGRIRATVDTKQAVWDQRFKSYPNYNRSANLPNSLVVEFKFNREHRDYASSVLQGMPLRVSRHSKYINGVRAIQGYK
jgi:hypothetical protein